jgi:hypothetical protein
MVGPVYPLIVASVFKVFGVYTLASAIAIRILQSFFASLTCLFLYLCGRDTVGEGAGKLAALAWAVFPLNIFFAINRVWETTLTGFLAVVLFWMLLAARDSTSAARWSLTGALLGLAGLLNTSLVVFAIPFGLSALWRHRTRMVPPIAAGILACAAVASPWLVRNYVQFGKFMLRSNFPLEFRVGNNPSSYGQKVEALHPSNNPALNRHWQDIGEMQFMEEQRVQNARFLAANFDRFLLNTGNRIVNYWTGAWMKTIPAYPNDWAIIVPTSLLSFLGFLGVWQLFRRRNSAALMFAGCLGVYPIVYYLTTAQPRFYHTVTPLLILSASSWVVSRFSRNAVPAGSTGRSRDAQRDLAGNLAVRMTRAGSKARVRT